MLVDLAAVAIGLAVLVFSADRFITGAGTTARSLGVPPLIVGLTVIGFGTSAPELAVSVIAAFEGQAGIAIGNVIGSNIANITLVLGTAAALAPLTVHAALVRRELPVVIAVSALVYLLALDHSFSAFDGLVLLAVLAALLFWLSRFARTGGDDPLAAELETGPEHMPLPRALGWVAAGLVMLPASSQALVWGAGNIAAALGVSELVIGLSVVAVGTSLPELATAVAALRRNEHDLVLGNVVGSNLFNLLAVLPMPALLAAGRVPDGALWRDLPIMLGVIVLVAVLRLDRRARISRPEGILLLSLFAAYAVLLYHTRFQ